MKKTQKTPKREIEQAKRNMKDFVEGALKMSKTKVSPIGSSWDKFEKRAFIAEEIRYVLKLILFRMKIVYNMIVI